MTTQPNVLDTFGHGVNWSNWLGHLKGQPAAGLELGTFRGASADWALENIFTHPDSSYVCVDTFEGSDEHKVNSIDCTSNEKITHERLSKYGDRVSIYKEYSDVFLRNAWTAFSPVFDFVYVDAAHDAMNVLRDGVLGFDLLKTEGIMIFDDYNWKAMPREIDRPKMGVDAFVSCYADRIHVIAYGWQVAIRKLK